MERQIQKMYDALIEGLHAICNEETDIIQRAKRSARKCMDAMQELREHIIANPFSTATEEIAFFKETKPMFHSHLAYWMRVLDIELNRPLGGKEEMEKYLRLQLLHLKLNYDKQASFYNYYRHGETGMDDRYFLRKNNFMNINDPRAVDCDQQFSTSHDYFITLLLANTRVQDYLSSALASLDQSVEYEKTNIDKAPLQWTASKAGLVELIYAFQSNGVFNNGQAGINEIALYFEKLFAVELGNYYHVFNEIRLRKKSRSQMLDQLKDKLITKMDELDVK